MKRCPFCSGNYIVILTHEQPDNNLGHCETEGCILGYGLIRAGDWERRHQETEIDHA